MTIEDGPGDTLNPRESVDSDELRNNDGDDVVEPPEGWRESDKFGTTPREEREGEPLTERLAEEAPDVGSDLAEESEGIFPPDDIAAEIDGRDPLSDDLAHTQQEADGHLTSRSQPE